MLLQLLLLFTYTLFPVTTTEEPDHSGTYTYDVKHTPYGDFAGRIVVEKEKKGYKVAIINDKGENFNAVVTRQKSNRIVLNTNFEHMDAVLYGYFKVDKLIARIEGKGDPFLYKLIAWK